MVYYKGHVHWRTVESSAVAGFDSVTILRERVSDSTMSSRGANPVVEEEEEEQKEENDGNGVLGWEW